MYNQPISYKVYIKLILSSFYYSSDANIRFCHLNNRNHNSRSLPYQSISFVYTTICAHPRHQIMRNLFLACVTCSVVALLHKTCKY